MNKTDLISSVALSCGITKASAERAVNAFLDTVEKELASGSSVSIVGFGSFQVSARAERTGRNPQTGQEIKIAAAKVPSFKAGKALKEAVNC